MDVSEFRKALEEAVTQRGSPYQKKCIVIFHFEDDRPEADVKTLSYSFTDVFGFDEVAVRKLEKKDRFPVFESQWDDPSNMIQARVGNPLH